MNKNSEYTAVISDGNSGVGSCLTQRMLDENYTVIVLDRKKPQLKHERLVHVGLNLNDDKAVSSVAKDIAKKHKVTHFIHNADLIESKQLLNAKASDINNIMQYHLSSALTLMQSFLPSMKKRRFGRVIFNSSRSALGLASHTSYSAAKSGMIGMARTWALELAQHKITVNVVAPGPILTECFLKSLPKGIQPEKDIAKLVPVGRLGSVDDVANAFMYFADEKSGFVTGQTLYVCGGTSVGTAIN